MATTRKKTATAEAAPQDQGLRVIKKYPNRRLYDTDTSTYVTLAEVKSLVMAGTSFVVRDAKTGDDLTRSILLQIILEEEAAGSPIFSETVLANIIRFYGHAMQGFFGANLESSIQAFADMQKKAMDMAPALGGGSDAWQNMLQQPLQGMQKIQEQMQQQYQSNLQKWMDAFKPTR